MGRQAGRALTLPTGQRVGYSLTDRPGGYRVRFVGPAGGRAAAGQIIAASFRPAGAASPDLTWAAAPADLDATADLRPDSVRGYASRPAPCGGTSPSWPAPPRWRRRSLTASIASASP